MPMAPPESGGSRSTRTPYGPPGPGKSFNVPVPSGVNMNQSSQQQGAVGQPSTTSSGSYSSGGASARPSGGGAPIASPPANRPGPVERTAPPPPPSINKYLAGDDQFQQNRENLIKNFRSMRAKNRENRTNLRSDYDVTTGRLGKEQSQAAEQMEADFAARGLLGSGVYQDALNDFNLGYQNQGNDAKESYRKSLQQLITDMQDARRGRNSDMQQLRLDAIRRRAEQYGIR